MSDNKEAAPVMNGGDDETTDKGKLAGLIEQVDQDHGAEGAAAMSDQLRDRMEETKAEPEGPGDLED